MTRTDEIVVSEVWAETAKALEVDYNLSARQLSYLRMTHPVGMFGNNIVLAVAQESTRNMLETSLKEDLMSALSEVLGYDASFAIQIDPQFHENIAGPVVDIGTDDEDGDPLPPVDHIPLGHSKPQPAPQLNPQYTFESFVIGSSNRFAHAAALAVAEAPAKAYNPLFIYGGSGLGKTHLLHAIGTYSHKLYPTMKVRYVPSEGFLNDFINAVREGKGGSIDLFKRSYRDVDILLIDDIQFLQGKKETLEEFFWTFNELQQAGKQVVITSDQPPKELHGFDNRLKSRFAWGLTTDIQTPDIETRIAILRRKAEEQKCDISAEVLGYIGQRITTNIRELEGALTRVAAFASLNNRSVDTALAEVVLRDIITNPENEVVKPATIIAEVGAYFGVALEDLCGGRRTRALSEARQIAMYLCRVMCEGLSYPDIAKLFNRKDHTTAMYAVKKVEEAIAEKVTIYNQVSELTSRIKQKSLGTALAA